MKCELRNTHQSHTYSSVKVNDTTKDTYCGFSEKQNNNSNGKLTDLEQVGPKLKVGLVKTTY